MAADATARTAQVEIEPTAARGSDAIGNPVLGMLLFIGSEIMFFAALFAAYFSVRAGFTETVNGVATHVWPPTQFADLLKPLPLVLPSGALNLIVPATLILIASSATCQIGVNAIRRDDRRGFLRGFSATIVMGVTFLALQAYDWTVLMHEGLSAGTTTFGTTYFTLTGFHSAHVLGGILMLAVAAYRGMSGQFSSRHWDMVAATVLYWHFVDVVWILLFSILYLL